LEEDVSKSHSKRTDLFLLWTIEAESQGGPATTSSFSFAWTLITLSRLPDSPSSLVCTFVIQLLKRRHEMLASLKLSSTSSKVLQTIKEQIAWLDEPPIDLIVPRNKMVIKYNR
jgi:hypothetical protein